MANIELKKAYAYYRTHGLFVKGQDDKYISVVYNAGFMLNTSASFVLVIAWEH